METCYITFMGSSDFGCTRKGKVFGLAFTENNEVYPDAKTNIQGYHFDAHTTAVFPAGVLGWIIKGPIILK